MSETEVLTSEVGTVEEKFVHALKAFLISLLSRKFIATVVLAYGLYVEKRYWEAATVVGSFLGIEGAADLVERKEAAKPQTPIVQDAENVTVEAPQRTPTRKRTSRPRRT